MKTTIFIMMVMLLFVTACTTPQEEIELYITHTIEPIAHYNNTNETIEPGQEVYLNISDKNKKTIYVKTNDIYVKTNITLEE